MKVLRMEMNKYQEALDRIEETYCNLDNCLSAMKRFGKDIQTLSELVEKENPKKWDEDYVLEQKRILIMKILNI